MSIRKIKNKNSGFTLIEIIVATSIFTVVMLITIGALLSLNDASRKAQAIRTVIDNLNFALEDMGRKIRTGSNYHCYRGDGVNNVDPFTGQIDITPQSCGGDPAGYIITLKNQDGDWVAYQFYKDPVTLAGSIREKKSDPKGATTLEQNWSAITAPEVNIGRMEFRVIGANPLDRTQPMVLLSMAGVVDLKKDKLRSDFSLQTAISKRGTE